ncbi:MAG: RHS repeat-associated core domain-containing protein [Candidatus Omnitrophota bacterium]
MKRRILFLGIALILLVAQPSWAWVCGDANADGKVDVGDVVYLVNYLFKNGPAPAPLESGDVNIDGKVDVGDVVYLINYLFKNGPSPCRPYYKRGFVDGIVYDASTELPLQDALITSPDQVEQAYSDSQGRFSITIEKLSPSSNEFTTSIKIEKTSFTSCQRQVKVVTGRHSAVNPVYLTPQDSVVTQITPSGGTHINSTGQIQLIFPEGAVTEPINVVSTKYEKSQALPDELPSTTFFTYAVDLQPDGATFNQPVTMRVANTLGFAAGIPIPAGIFNEETGQWQDTGLMGYISADGLWLEYQINHFSPWDLNLPAVPPPQDRKSNMTANNTQDAQIQPQQAKDPGVGVKSGSLTLEHSLPQVKRLGRPYDLKLVYTSLTAQPSNFISIETDLDPVTTNIPATTTFKVDIAGRQAQATYQGVSGKVRYAYLFDGKDALGQLLTSGSYPYTIEASNDYTNATYWTTANFGGAPIANTGVLTIEPVPMTRNVNGYLTINSQQDSPFGAGWSIEGLQRLHFSPDGAILLTEGDGSAIIIRQHPQPLAFTGNWTSRNSSVIDYQENEVISTIPISGTPHGVCVTSDGKYALINHVYSPYVSLINTATKKVEKVINANVSQSCWINSSPITGEICVSDLASGKVGLLDGVTFEPTQTINVGSGPCGAVYSHDGSRLYVSNRNSNTVSVIDTQTKEVIATLNTGNNPNVIDITNDDRFLYVPNNSSNTVSVIDLVSQQVIKTIAVGSQPLSAGVSPDNKYVLVTNFSSNNVSVIDTINNEVIATIPDIMRPIGLAFSPDAKYAYVTEGNASRVAVIDIDNFSILTRISVGAGPHGIDIATEDVFTTALGDYSTFVLNSDGTSVRKMKDATKINFDALGLETSMVDRNGNTTQYIYIDANSDGRAEEISEIILPAGGKYEFIYNTSGKLQSIKDPAGRITQFNIDASGDLSGITNPDTTTKAFTYNSHFLTAATNERNLTTQYQYDNYGRVNRMLFPNSPQEIIQFFPSEVQGLINDLAPGVGTPQNPAPVVRPADIVETIIDGKGYTTTSQTSKFGSYAKIIDALNQTTTIERDVNNNPTKITRPNSSTVTMTYDAKGNLRTSTENAISATTTFTYEPNFNQVSSILDPESNLTDIDYDTKGNPIQITDALGNITKMEYNSPYSLLSKIISGFGTPLQNETNFTYDPVTENLLTITDPLSHTTTLAYDNAGNITSSTDADNNTTTFEYDSMNRLKKVVDADNKTTQYQYDEAGSLKKIIDSKLHETNFTYDEINQLKTIANPLTKTKTFSYDLNRNLGTVIDFKGQTISFTYDQINRLTNKSGPGLNVTNGYDSVNNLTSVTNPDSGLTMNYDLAGRLTQATTANLGHQPATTISYTYDKNSNRLTLTDPQSVVTKYIYDDLNRLIDIKTAADQLISHFGYDQLSRRTALILANNTQTAYGYDLASRLLSMVTSLNPKSHNKLVSGILHLESKDTQSTLDSYTYTYDSVGNREEMTDLTGLHDYGYDDLYRLTQATHPTFPTEDYTYDPVGNRNPASFVYDVANRLVDDGTYTYIYDDNGNLITKTNKSNPSDVTTYGYNVENQLISIDYGPSTIDYIYDGLGRRIEKNVNEVITRYVYDNEDILAEYDVTNTLTAKYLHGPGIDEPLRMERGGQLYYYHVDGLGSITALTDNTGAVVRTYTYDSFGNIVNQTGTLSNPFTYTGREFDSETGLYYYRARYYDARIGRFLQEDSFKGFLTNSLTLNLYPYVLNNPVIYVDPYGNVMCMPPWIIVGTTMALSEPTQFGKVAIIAAVGGYALYQAIKGPSPEPYPGAGKGKRTGYYKIPPTIPATHNPIPPLPPDKWKKLIDDIAEWLSHVFGI